MLSPEIVQIIIAGALVVLAIAAERIDRHLKDGVKALREMNQNLVHLEKITDSLRGLDVRVEMKRPRQDPAAEWLDENFHG